MIATAIVIALVAAPASQGLIDASLASFRAGDYDAALIGFTRAFKASPEQSRLLWNIGRCFEELGKTEEALAKFEAYLELEVDDAGGIREALTKVAKLRAAAAPRSATLRVETNPPKALVIVDGEPVGTSPVLLDVPEGDHVIAAKLEGRLDAETRVSATAGQPAIISLALPEVPQAAPPMELPPTPPRDTRAWIAPAAIGVAGVLLTALAVHAFLDSGEHDDDAVAARRRGGDGDLSAAAAGALASDAEDRATLQSALGWTFATAAASTLGWTGWKLFTAD